jgi:hypothetical protein
MSERSGNDSGQIFEASGSGWLRRQEEWSMRYIFNTLIVLFSVFSLPLLFFFGEWKDILWVRIVAAVLLIPYMLWWGFYGYNFFFGKKTRDDEDQDERG